MSKRTLLGIAIALSLLAGCLSQTVSEEGGWDPAGRVRVNGLYQLVTVDLTTGDTSKMDRRFYRFRNDGTFQLTLVYFQRPLVFDSVAHADTTTRFMAWWERRGRFSVGSDSITYSDLQHRTTEYDDQFLPWETDSVKTRSVNIAKTYRVFTSDTWITHTEPSRDIGMGVVSDSFCDVIKRIGDENKEIPWEELRP